jgi:hypothetical protein
MPSTGKSLRSSVEGHFVDLLEAQEHRKYAKMGSERAGYIGCAFTLEHFLRWVAIQDTSLGNSITRWLVPCWMGDQQPLHWSSYLRAKR